ncbi:hypothetical protein BJ742DRAFT_877684 [Cladochytrium replicatum]|nr:hypothetical protein BJ742DRAFT_877684 [Cladochytrium replicatum]
MRMPELSGLLLVLSIAALGPANAAALPKQRYVSPSVPMSRSPKRVKPMRWTSCNWTVESRPFTKWLYWMTGKAPSSAQFPSGFQKAYSVISGTVRTLCVDPYAAAELPLTGHSLGTHARIKDPSFSQGGAMDFEQGGNQPSREHDDMMPQPSSWFNFWYIPYKLPPHYLIHLVNCPQPLLKVSLNRDGPTDRVAETWNNRARHFLDRASRHNFCQEIEARKLKRSLNNATTRSYYRKSSPLSRIIFSLVKDRVGICEGIANPGPRASLLHTDHSYLGKPLIDCVKTEDDVRKLCRTFSTVSSERSKKDGALGSLALTDRTRT